MIDFSKIPAPVRMICSRLKNIGHEAYIVGGCVRDLVMGREPHDWDITTSAQPDEVVGLFPKVVLSGISFGTVTIVLEDSSTFEVTTYRTEGKYSDGRRPDEVVFTKSLEEDLARRDFAMNAMALDPEYTDKIIDPFDGLGDIEQRFISCVGEARDRFLEDGLRVLRACRFAATLGFHLDIPVFEAMQLPEVKANLMKVSKERVQAEIHKGLEGLAPQIMFTYMEKCGLLGVLNVKSDWPIVQAAEDVPFSKVPYRLRLAMMCAWLRPGKGAENTAFKKDWLHGLKFPNQEADYAAKVSTAAFEGTALIAKGNELDLLAHEVELRHFASKVGPDIALAALELAPYLMIFGTPDIEADRMSFRRLARMVIEGNPFSTADLALKGGEIGEFIGVQGKEIGVAQKLLLSHVLIYPEDNSVLKLKMILNRHYI